MKFRSRLCPISAVDTPMHKHDENEIIINKEGNGILTVEGQDYQLGPGTVVCIPANMMHRDFSATPRLSGTITFPPDNGHVVPNLIIFYDHNQMFEKLFDLIVETDKEKSQYLLEFRRTLGDAAYTLLQSRGAGVSKANNDFVDQIDQSIRQNFTDPDFDLLGEIQKAGYNTSYFRRLYRKAFGRPPQAQLTYIRIEYAKSMMRLYHDRYSVKEFCLKSGFRDPLYFSRVFKQYEQVSPSEYLQKCKQGIKTE